MARAKSPLFWYRQRWGIPPVPQRPDGTIPLSIYEIELEQLAEYYADQIKKFGAQNVALFESNATPEQLAEELDQIAGQQYDVDAEARVLEQQVSPEKLVGGSTGSADLDRELLDLQREAGLSAPETQEDVSPEDALADLSAQMDALGL